LNWRKYSTQKIFFQVNSGLLAKLFSLKLRFWHGFLVLKKYEKIFFYFQEFFFISICRFRKLQFTAQMQT